MQAEVTESVRANLYRDYLCARFDFNQSLTGLHVHGPPRFRTGDVTGVRLALPEPHNELQIAVSETIFESFSLTMVQHLGENIKKLELNYLLVQDSIADFSGIDLLDIKAIEFRLPDNKIIITKREQVTDLLAKPKIVEYRERKVNVKLGVIMALLLTILIATGALL